MSWEAEQHDKEWPFEDHATRFDLNPDSTVLLVVDTMLDHALRSTGVRSRVNH